MRDWTAHAGTSIVITGIGSERIERFVQASIDQNTIF
jgi:hypothetical protein